MRSSPHRRGEEKTKEKEEKRQRRKSRRDEGTLGENILMPVMANEPIILNVYDMVSG